VARCNPPLRGGDIDLDCLFIVCITTHKQKQDL
jgi:hypothetical protein